MKKAEVHNICTELETENYDSEKAYMQWEHWRAKLGEEAEVELEEGETLNGCTGFVDDMMER